MLAQNAVHHADNVVFAAQLQMDVRGGLVVDKFDKVGQRYIGKVTVLCVCKFKAQD